MIGRADIEGSKSNVGGMGSGGYWWLVWRETHGQPDLTHGGGLSMRPVCLPPPAHWGYHGATGGSLGPLPSPLTEATRGEFSCDQHAHPAGHAASFFRVLTRSSIRPLLTRAETGVKTLF